MSEDPERTKKKKKEDQTKKLIWGIFLQVSESRPYVWHSGDDAKYIISILRFMIRKSAQSSPTAVTSSVTSTTTIPVEEKSTNPDVSGSQSTQAFNNTDVDVRPNYIGQFF